MEYNHLIPKLKEFMINSRKDIEIGCVIDVNDDGKLVLSNYNMGKVNSVKLPTNETTIGSFHTHTDSYETYQALDMFSISDIQSMIHYNEKLTFLGYNDTLMVCEIFKFQKSFSRFADILKRSSGREWTKNMGKLKMFLYSRLKVVG